HNDKLFLKKFKERRKKGLTMNDFYRKNGYLVFKSVIDKKEATSQLKHFFHLKETFSNIPPDEISSHLLQNDPQWYELISSSSMLDVAEMFIGKDIAHFYSRYFAKSPHIGRAVPWHQDGAYYPLDPIRLCTLWVSLTHSTPNNGCLRIIPGSQHSKLREIKKSDDPKSILKRVMDSDNIGEEKAVDIITEPGDVVIIDPKVIHSSNINKSSEWRIGLAVRYIPTDVKITWQSLYGSPWDCAFMLRGMTKNNEFNNYLPAPQRRK
ncbi:phytanoyl-CoA dioxygenase family protein, partial [Photorhabdus luminescens]|uniref:phytanoyl-CoA dioxygenase family protein n=1 Tax=Photorhabdus luminescens TaxID=29488 RepID=UPI00223ED60F